MSRLSTAAEQARAPDLKKVNSELNLNHVATNLTAKSTTTRNPSSNHSLIMSQNTFSQLGTVVEIKDEKYEIVIGHKEVLFTPVDPIFEMTGPIAASSRNSQSCSVCNSNLAKQKALHHCDFCGERACEKCLYKTRKFKSAESPSITKSESELKSSSFKTNRVKPSASTVSPVMSAKK